jgi:uncharacterized protein YuzE
VKRTYDRESDTLYVFLAIGAEVHRQQQVNPGFILDADAAGRVVGIEIIGATADYGPDILDLHWVSGGWKSSARSRLNDRCPARRKDK